MPRLLLRRLQWKIHQAPLIRRTMTMLTIKSLANHDEDVPRPSNEYVLLQCAPLSVPLSTSHLESPHRIKNNSSNNNNSLPPRLRKMIRHDAPRVAWYSAHATSSLRISSRPAMHSFSRLERGAAPPSVDDPHTLTFTYRSLLVLAPTRKIYRNLQYIQLVVLCYLLLLLRSSWWYSSTNSSFVTHS